jgi:hypothetical protein
MLFIIKQQVGLFMSLLDGTLVGGDEINFDGIDFDGQRPILDLDLDLDLKLSFPTIRKKSCNTIFNDYKSCNILKCIT